MSTPEFQHKTVLLHESIDALNIKPDGIYIDGTFGRGGHSRLILEHLGTNGKLIAFDRDPQAIAAAQSLAHDKRFQIVHEPFSHLHSVIDSMDLVGQISGILLDLGVSSPQLDDAERGFSFMRDGPLDMRMDTTRGESAAQWLAHADADDITWVLKTFGEEKFGKRIAHAIVTTREQNPLTRTLQLAELISQAVPVKDKHKHPATRSFQAIRIYINAELDELEKALAGASAVLSQQGRLAVIAFHSLEDRMVKRFMREQSSGKKVPRGMPISQQELDASKVLKLIGRATKPEQTEVNENVRSRSSVLRVAEKL